MIILERTDKYMIGLSHDSRAHPILSIINFETDDNMHLYYPQSNEFIVGLEYIHLTRTNPASMHYNRTLNQSIDYLIENLSVSNKERETYGSHSQ